MSTIEYVSPKPISFNPKTCLLCTQLAEPRRRFCRRHCDSLTLKEKLDAIRRAKP
jgi:hypothetical protein